MSVGAVSSYTLSNVTAGHSIAASFEINTYTITAITGENGSISPAGSAAVNHGSDQVFSISPSDGYHIDDVLVDGVSVGRIDTYSFNDVTSNHTIEASFAINTYGITSAAGENGSILPDGNKPNVHFVIF